MGKYRFMVKLGLYFEEVGLYFEESIGLVLPVGVVTGSDSGSCDAGYCQVGRTDHSHGDTASLKALCEQSFYTMLSTITKSFSFENCMTLIHTGSKGVLHTSHFWQ